MKKVVISALALALIGASIGSFAQATATDHSSHAQHGMVNADMQAMHQEMHKKMSAAKTDDERQTLMAEHMQSMQAQHGQMMAMHAHGHDMKALSAHSAEHHEMMEKHMETMKH